MEQDLVEVKVRSVKSTSNGTAVFLECEPKTFLMFVEPSIGTLIRETINPTGKKPERPLTHDLIGLILTGLEADIEWVIVNDVDEGTYYARIILKMDNELGTKIVELDARPSDSIVLALQLNKPIFASRNVLDKVDDMSALLDKMEQD